MLQGYLLSYMKHQSSHKGPAFSYEKVWCLRKMAWFDAESFMCGMGTPGQAHLRLMRMTSRMRILRSVCFRWCSLTYM